MPNWAEGYLRVRGTKEAIAKFVNNEFIFYEFANAGVNPMHINIDPSEEDFYIPVPESKYIYIDTTRRNFIFKDLYGYFDDSNGEIHTAAFKGFKAAWDVDTDPYVKFSKQYGLNFKIDVYEKGMHFSHHILIEDGCIVSDDTKKYKDWAWECPCPDFGG